GRGPYDALAAATLNGGRLLGEPGAGPLTQGGPADFLLVHGDPLSDPGSLWRGWGTSWESLITQSAGVATISYYLCPTTRRRGRAQPVVRAMLSAAAGASAALALVHGLHPGDREGAPPPDGGGAGVRRAGGRGGGGPTPPGKTPAHPAGCVGCRPPPPSTRRPGWNRRTPCRRAH